jgi:hypothetical protein
MTGANQQDQYMIHDTFDMITSIKQKNKHHRPDVTYYKVYRFHKNVNAVLSWATAAQFM